MPASETLTKLSDSMSDLAQKAKEAESRTAAARAETREQLETRAAEARAGVQRRREQISGRAADAKGDMAADWASVRTQVDDQSDKMHHKIGELRAGHDVKVAQRRAESAEDYAFGAVDFAMDAVSEAEAAVLEAADARAIADAKVGTSVAG